MVIVSDEIYEPIHWADEPFTSFAEACPSLVRPHAYRQRRLESLRNDGLANRLRGRPSRADRCDDDCAKPEHLERLQRVAGSRNRGPRRRSGRRCEMAAEYRLRHDYVVAALNDIPGFECRAGEGTFYALPRVSGAIERLGLADDIGLTEHLINTAMSPSCRAVPSAHRAICACPSPAPRRCSKRRCNA